MTEAVTIDNDELAILCDIVSGWGVKNGPKIRVQPRPGTWSLDRALDTSNQHKNRPPLDINTHTQN